MTTVLDEYLTRTKMRTNGDTSKLLLRYIELHDEAHSTASSRQIKEILQDALGWC